MINDKQYFGQWRYSPDLTAQCLENGLALIEVVNNLMHFAESDGVVFLTNPATGSQISGATYGGFRPLHCPIGAVNSAHKQGKAVDLYDPTGSIDNWCMKESGPGGLLEQVGIYIEHPDATPHWSHWSTKAPASGRRVFHP